MDGDAAKTGFDPLALPFDRFLNWVHAWFLERLSEKDRRMFELQLTRPMAGEVSPEWSEEALAADWEAFADDIGARL